MKKGWLEKYQDGGNLLAYNDDIPIFPKIKKNNNDSLKFTKSEKVVNPYGGLETVSETREVPDVREQYMRENLISTAPTKNVNFNLAINSDDSKQFLNRYNNPWSRQKLKEQSNLTDANIDNMILQGLSPKVKIGGNQSNSKGEYDYENNQILMSEKNAPVETHERIHASNIDAPQGEYLSKILGNPFQQEGKSAFNNVRRYMQKPHEAYGNFAEFREKIGLKPGEQITEQELKKRVKAKNLSEENFYKVYNDKKIVEALNTVASNNKLQPLDIAQNGTEMNYYREGKDWKPRGMQNGGWLEKYTSQNGKKVKNKDERYQAIKIKDEITPEMVDEYYKLKPENRLNSFMDMTDKNKNLIREVSKIAPSVAGASYLATQGQSKFQDGGTVKEDIEWLQNWYQNRVIPNKDIQDAYLEDKPIYTERLKNIPPVTNVNTIDNNPSITGQYQGNTGKLLMTPNAQPSVYTHEVNHYLNDFPSTMRTVHDNVVEQNMYKKGDSRLGVNNENYEYFRNPDEIHSRVQVMRKDAGFKPDEEVTQEKLLNYLKNYKGNDENILQLMNITDEKGLLEMLNYMAEVPKNKKSKLNYAEQGGIIEDDRGQWAHPGKITKINSNQITMKGVNSSLLGISDKGDVQLMHPNKEYKFKGNNVTEFPINNWLNKYN